MLAFYPLKPSYIYHTQGHPNEFVDEQKLAQNVVTKLEDSSLEKLNRDLPAMHPTRRKRVFIEEALQLGRVACEEGRGESEYIMIVRARSCIFRRRRLYVDWFGLPPLVVYHVGVYHPSWPDETVTRPARSFHSVALIAINWNCSADRRIGISTAPGTPGYLLHF